MPAETALLPGAVLLADACLVLLQCAQQGGQDLYRLAVGMCMLVLHSGHSMIQQHWQLPEEGGVIEGDVAAAMALKVPALRNLLHTLEQPWAASTLPAVARTAARSRLLFAWFVAAGHALQQFDDGELGFRLAGLGLGPSVGRAACAA